MAGAVCVTVGLLLSGCGGGSGASGTSGGGEAGQLRPSGMAEGEQMDVAAPLEAQFTLYCRDFTGPNHAQVAEQVKRQVEEGSGLHDFYVVRGDQRTVLYHGFYETFDEEVDRRKAKKAQADRDLLERLTDSNGSRIFPRTVFEPLDRPDPSAPPEWDLTNADGYWTVLVNTYTESAQRKEVAVETVREMRQNGIEAYFFHKGGQSHICIGTWPRSAVKEQQNTGDERLINPDDPETIIVSTTELDENFNKLVDERGRPVKVFQVKVEPVDPTLAEALEEYEYTVNGVRTQQEPKPAPLLDIGETIGQKRAIDEAPTDPLKKKDLQNLLQRPF